MSGPGRVVTALAALVAALALVAVPAVATGRESILNLREGAADPETAARLQAANDWWQAQHPGRRPERKEEMRPPGSNLLWVYYRRQGFFPNWVAGARDLLRRERVGDMEGYDEAVDEIVSYSRRRVSPDGLPFRAQESVYLSTDSTAPPWRDAMGQGLILTTLIPTLDEASTPADRERILTLATEYLNAFAVDWEDGGVATDGFAGGNWYLEYATPRGDEHRVLNGFMQSIVSLDRFATQADGLAADPRWAELRDRAREYVRLAALEVDAQLPTYDLGDGLSRYSLRNMDPAPDVYQTYHRQLLLRLQNIAYLPEEWREHFDETRVAWGGEPIDEGIPWWAWIVVGLGSLGIVAAALRLRTRRRLARGSG